MKIKFAALTAFIIMAISIPALADTKISAMSSGSPAQGSDVFPIVRSGTNYKLSLSDVATYSVSNRSMIIPFNASASGTATWTDMPSAATIFNATGASSAIRVIHKADLTGYTQCRLTANEGSVAGASGAKLIAKYATSFVTSAGGYSDLGASEISAAIDVASTSVTSSWINIAAGAKGDVFVTIIGSGGDGVTDPNLGVIELQCR